MSQTQPVLPLHSCKGPKRSQRFMSVDCLYDTKRQLCTLPHITIIDIQCLSLHLAIYFQWKVTRPSGGGVGIRTRDQSVHLTVSSNLSQRLRGWGWVELEVSRLGRPSPPCHPTLASSQLPVSSEPPQMHSSPSPRASIHFPSHSSFGVVFASV